MSEPPAPLYAAVDLGSHSFHAVICQATAEGLAVVDRLKERVQLAAGLDAADRLSEEAQWRALAVLRRFGERLAALGPAQVRVVATSTLRRAVNRETFLALGEEALGHPIEVISGQEEARLVFLGVNHSVADAGERRLVVDIGGGSTECIVGEVDAIARADSLHMGCVSWSQRFFPEGRITAEALEEAVIAARLELGPVHRLYRDLGFEICYGSSGTVTAVQAALTETGWSPDVITREGLERMGQALVAAGSAAAIELPGIKPERREVLAGGFAVLMGVFRALKIREMHASKAALREGVVFDLLGQARHDDVCEQTVGQLQARFGVDIAQAARVEGVAVRLLHQAGPALGLEGPAAERYLRWGARLHELGRAVSYSGHNRHGAYIVSQADMPGFSQQEQGIVAGLLIGHRGKYKRERLLALGVRQVERVERLIMLLRLAVSLNRTRSPNPRPAVDLQVEGRQMVLVCPPRYLAERPLTRADLEREARAFASLGFVLTWA